MMQPNPQQNNLITQMAQPQGAPLYKVNYPEAVKQGVGQVGTNIANNLGNTGRAWGQVAQGAWNGANSAFNNYANARDKMIENNPTLKQAAPWFGWHDPNVPRGQTFGQQIVNKFK